MMLIFKANIKFSTALTDHWTRDIKLRQYLHPQSGQAGWCHVLCTQEYAKHTEGQLRRENSRGWCRNTSNKQPIMETTAMSLTTPLPFMEVNQGHAEKFRCFPQLLGKQTRLQNDGHISLSSYKYLAGRHIFWCCLVCPCNHQDPSQNQQVK